MLALGHVASQLRVVGAKKGEHLVEQFRARLVPLAAGGDNGTTFFSSAELYDAGLGFLDSSRPVISSATSPKSSGRWMKMSYGRLNSRRMREDY